MPSVYDEFAADVDKLVVEKIEAAEAAYDETFKGTPFGAEALSDDLFVVWFEGMDRANRNWTAFLPLEDSGEGKRTLERYVRLRESDNVQPSGAGQGLPPMNGAS